MRFAASAFLALALVASCSESPTAADYGQPVPAGNSRVTFKVESAPDGVRVRVLQSLMTSQAGGDIIAQREVSKAEATSFLLSRSSSYAFGYHLETDDEGTLIEIPANPTFTDTLITIRY